MFFVGPGRGGKTTNLEHIFSRIRHRIESDMVSIKTQGDRTLFFDFLPFEPRCHQRIQRKNAAVQPVPGQVKYNATTQTGSKGCRWDRIRRRFHGRPAGEQHQLTGEPAAKSRVLRYRYRQDPRSFFNTTSVTSQRRAFPFLTSRHWKKTSMLNSRRPVSRPVR